jgi:hypothetical protein
MGANGRVKSARETMQASALPNTATFAASIQYARRAVISDWKFFLTNDDWLRLWARRYGVSAVEALANETTTVAMACNARLIRKNGDNQ